MNTWVEEEVDLTMLVPFLDIGTEV